MLGVGWLKFENDQIFDATFVDVASHADVLRLVTEERVTSLRTSAWEATIILDLFFEEIVTTCRSFSEELRFPAKCFPTT